MYQDRSSSIAKNGTRMTSRRAPTYAFSRASMSQPIRPTQKSRWATILSFGQTNTTRPGIFTFLWGTIQSYFRILPSLESSPTGSSGQLTNEKTCRLASPIACRPIFVYGKSGANRLSGACVLLCKRRTRPRPVCGGCGEVLFQHRRKRQLPLRINHKLGRPERCESEEIPSCCLAERIAQRSRAEARLRAIHGSRRRLVGLSCRGLQR